MMRVLLAGGTEAIGACLGETVAAANDVLLLEARTDDGPPTHRAALARTFRLAGPEASPGVRRTQARNAFARLLMEGRPDVVHLLQVDIWSLELARVASLFRLPVLMDLATYPERLADPRDQPMVRDALGRIDAFRLRVGFAAPEGVEQGRLLDAGEPLADAYRRLAAKVPPSHARLDYSLYEFGLRDQGVIEALQARDVHRFQDCGLVLDLACGPGVFLELLREASIPAEGVERSPEAVAYARGIGLTVHEEDVLAFLARHRDAYEGIYCSHFIEHLPFDAARELIAGVAGALRPGGRAVFVFPNPESIRSQLLGFWRDPEHVRFYHPELVALMARGEGLDVVEGGEGKVVPAFPAQPPMRVSQGTPASDHGRAAGAPPGSAVGGWWRALLRRAGILPGRDALGHVARLERRVEALEQRVLDEERARSQVREAIEILWSVNATWHWEDNATLVLRKPPTR